MYKGVLNWSHFQSVKKLKAPILVAKCNQQNIRSKVLDFPNFFIICSFKIGTDDLAPTTYITLFIMSNII